MKRIAALAMAMVVAAPAVAFAQAAAPTQLSYVQPLTPNAMQMVQDHLRQQGAYSGQTDGVWGPDSQAALSQFQQTHGLQVTGQMNQATAILLGLNPSDLLGPATPTAPATPPASGTVLSVAAVRNLQTRLRQLGYYNGAIDGVWGPGAQSAITRFQQASGIAVSGRINPQTVTAMGLNPNDLTAPAQ